MINFSGISNKRIFGKILRFPLHLLPKHLILPIIQGPNKGYKWIIGSGAHGYWLGSYEMEKQIAIEKLVESGMIAYDIGAHVGFYTILFSRKVVSFGNVCSFEPNPRNLLYLRKHIEINNISNCLIFPFALGETEGIVAFNDSLPSSMGHVIKNGKLLLPMCTIDILLEKRIIKPPDIIKIDVEGYELNVLKGMEKTLKKHRPILFIALDCYDTRCLVEEFLRKRKYGIFNLSLDYIKSCLQESEIVAF